MTGTARFVCSDPDVGDLEFADVEALLDAVEAGLLHPVTPLFDAARQNRQPLGVHPEVRAAWERRLRYRPPSGGLGLPDLPSITAVVRESPEADEEGGRRRAAFAAVRAGMPQAPPRAESRRRPVTFAVALWVALLLGLVAWGILTFAARLTEMAAVAARHTAR